MKSYCLPFFFLSRLSFSLLCHYLRWNYVYFFLLFLIRFKSFAPFQGSSVSFPDLPEETRESCRMSSWLLYVQRERKTDDKIMYWDIIERISFFSLSPRFTWGESKSLGSLKNFNIQPYCLSKSQDLSKSLEKSSIECIRFHFPYVL